MARWRHPNHDYDDNHGHQIRKLGSHVVTSVTIVVGILTVGIVVGIFTIVGIVVGIFTIVGIVIGIFTIVGIVVGIFTIVSIVVTIAIPIIIEGGDGELMQPPHRRW